MDKTMCLNSKVDGRQPSLQDRIYDVDGCSTAITTSFLPSIAEPKVINPLKGQSDNGWHFEQQVYDAEGITRAVKAGKGSGNIPKVVEPKIIQKFGDIGTSQYSVRDIAHTIPANAMSDRGQMVVEPLCSVHPNSHKLEFNPETSIKPIAPALRATDCKVPHCVYEPKIHQVGRGFNKGGDHNISPTVTSNSFECNNFVKEDWQTVVGNKQLNPFRGSVNECSPCITSACGAGGGMTPMLTDADLETTKTKEFIEQVRGHEQMRYRIRKLTPRECFRLMGVDDADIDTIQSAGISNSQQYKLAGNSIVVDVLYHLFRKMFVETENESEQLTLF